MEEIAASTTSKQKEVEEVVDLTGAIKTVETEVVVVEVEEMMGRVVEMVAPGSLGKEMMVVMLNVVETTSAVEAVVELTRWEEEVAPLVALLVNRFLMGVMGKCQA